MVYDAAACRHLDAFRRSLKEAEGEAGSFSLGIEEEYFLVDAHTGQVAFETPDSLFAEAHRISEGRVGREFLQTQVEAVTRPCAGLPQARAELHYIRSLLGVMAAEHGLAILACGTHPTAVWRKAVQSGKERYDRIMDDLQMIGQRNMLCGMHVHVELPDPGRRIEVMGRMIPYLSLLLALSTSSPFWQSRPTGLMGYRLAAYDELPRTGLPELFRTNEEFEAYVGALVQAGAIRDSSYVWWMIRPSARYPTLELRAPDCCTRLEDAIAIAALYRALARHLYFTRDEGDRLNAVTRALARENKWRAQRYGIHGSFVTRDGAVAVADFLDRVIAMTAEDADILGCADEIGHCRTILARGTSADAQVAIFQARTAQDGPDAAFADVVAWIAEETTVGIGRETMSWR